MEWILFWTILLQVFIVVIFFFIISPLIGRALLLIFQGFRSRESDSYLIYRGEPRE